MAIAGCVFGNTGLMLPMLHNEFVVRATQCVCCYADNAECVVTVTALDVLSWSRIHCVVPVTAWDVLSLKRIDCVVMVTRWLPQVMQSGTDDEKLRAEKEYYHLLYTSYDEEELLRELKAGGGAGGGEGEPPWGRARTSLGEWAGWGVGGGGGWGGGPALEQSQDQPL